MYILMGVLIAIALWSGMAQERQQSRREESIADARLKYHIGDKVLDLLEKQRLGEDEPEDWVWETKQ